MHRVSEAVFCTCARRGLCGAAGEQSPLAGSPHTAALLASRFEGEKFDLICCGDETLDNSSGIVGPLFAEMLDLPQVTGVGGIHSCSEKHLVVERNLDRGNRELVEMDLPGLITLRPESSRNVLISFRRLEERGVRKSSTALRVPHRALAISAMA